MTDWIPVSEALPEKRGKYIITWKREGGKETFITIANYDIIGVTENEITDGTYKFIGEWTFDDFILISTDGEVIAWMSLPEPYKAENVVKG